MTEVTAEGALELDAIGRLVGAVSRGGGYGEGGLIDVDEKDWNLAISGLALIASRVADSVGTLTPCRGIVAGFSLV